MHADVRAPCQLRQALNRRSETARSRRFRVRVFDSALQPGITLDNVADLLERMNEPHRLILVDANLLLHATSRGVAEHERARGSRR
jgi:hypothetical protein